MKSKIILLLLMLFVTASAVSAQDIITKTDDSSMAVKVVEITATTVKYKKYSNPDGPLYNIPISDIKAITYQNGTVEKFNEAPHADPNAQTSPTPESDDQLLREYQNLNNFATQSQSVSDQRLLALDMDWQKHEKNAKRLRKTAWIGGGAFVLGGLIMMSIAVNDMDKIPFPIWTACYGAGVVWCVGFNLAANHQVKKAREIKRIALSESTIFQSGKTRLTAGIDMLRDRNMPVLGAGLRLSF